MLLEELWCLKLHPGFKQCPLKNPASLLAALPLSATSLTKLKCSSLLTPVLFCSEAAEVCYGAETAPGAADKRSPQSVSKWKKIDGLSLLFKCFLNTFSCIMWPADLPHQSPHQTRSPQPQSRKMCMWLIVCVCIPLFLPPSLTGGPVTVLFASKLQDKVDKATQFSPPVTQFVKRRGEKKDMRED